MSPPKGLSQRAHRTGDQPVSKLMHAALSRPDLISLAAGFVDQESLPVEAMQQAFEAVISDAAFARKALQYGTTAGHEPLREAVLEHWRASDGDPECLRDVSIEQVLLTAGSNELLHLVGDTLCDEGDIILVAAPSYFVYLGMLDNIGVRPMSVAADEDGVIPYALNETLSYLDAQGELPRVKAIYLTTYFDNPSTATLAPERRGPIVEIAQRWSKHVPIRVIEDAAYRELRYTADDTPSLRSYDDGGMTVVATQTFSKSFSPGLRIGYGILPPDLVEPVAAMKANIDFGAPHFVQCVMAKVLELGRWQPHLEQLRRSYQTKLEAMLGAVDEHFSTIPGVTWTRPGGGLYVWTTLPEGVDTGTRGRLYHEALEEGVLYVPGEYSYAATGEPVRRNQMRLSFGVQSAARIREGIAALARAIQRVLNH